MMTGFSAIRIWSVVAALCLSAPMTRAASIVINNGLAPPTPSNIIGDETYKFDHVYVRNTGCPIPGAPDPGSPCPAPGASTEVAVTDTGRVGDLSTHDSSFVTMTGGWVSGRMRSYDTSSIVMTGGLTGGGILAYGHSAITMSSGGSIDDIQAHDSATVTLTGDAGTANAAWASGTSTFIMSGGSTDTSMAVTDFATFIMSGGYIGTDLHASGSSSSILSGGTVDMLYAADSALIEILGNSFTVDGVPVPYGDLSAQSGTIQGVFNSGTPFSNTFFQGGYGSTYTGTIRLVPEPNTALLVSLGLVGLAARRQR